MDLANFLAKWKAYQVGQTDRWDMLITCYNVLDGKAKDDPEYGGIAWLVRTCVYLDEGKILDARKYALSDEALAQGHFSPWIWLTAGLVSEADGKFAPAADKLETALNLLNTPGWLEAQPHRFDFFASLPAGASEPDWLAARIRHLRAWSGPMNPADLSAFYSSNPTIIDESLTGQKVILKGTIDSFRERPKAGRTVVFARLAKRSLPVECAFAYPNEISRCKTGDTMTLVGTYYGPKNASLLVYNCLVLP